MVKSLIRKKSKRGVKKKPVRTVRKSTSKKPLKKKSKGIRNTKKVPYGEHHGPKDHEPIMPEVTNKMLDHDGGQLYYLRMRVEDYCPKCKTGTTEITVHNDTADFTCVSCHFYTKLTQDDGVKAVLKTLGNCGYDC